jgi:hypothetical protein
MTPRSPLRALALLLPLLFLPLAVPTTVLGQPVPDDPAWLAPEARARLGQAAEDARLAPWQRDVMLRLARTGSVAAPAPAALDRGAPEPALASGAGDGAWVAAAIRPSARGYLSAIYDPVRNRMVVFGGDDNSSPHYFGDVWALSLAGAPAWTQLTPTGTPPSRRSAHSAIYDPVRDRMVVFGGRDSTGLYNEVWVLSLSGTPAWTQLTPTGAPPSARCSHSAIYDPLRDRMVVFGGSYKNDAWALSLAGTPAWTQLTPTGTPPSVRWGHSAIYDPVRDRMVVFGGYVLSGQELNDVWALSLAGTPAWTQWTPTGTPPRGRCCHSAMYDPVRDRMVMFGGVNPFLNDVWALSLTDTPAWTQLTPAGTLVSTRSSHGAIYDPVRDRMVVFGGIAETFHVLDDAWMLSLAGTPVWTLLTPVTGRSLGSVIYDPVRDRMVVFGGNNNVSYMNEVWELSLADTPAWTQLAPTGTLPTGRSSCYAIYDPVRDRMVFFAGNGPSIDLTEVWALSLAGTPAWTKLTPTGTPPTQRFFFSTIYDPVRDRMLVFGGSTPSVYLNDVWALSLADSPAWTQLAPTGPPPSGRYEHTTIYDPVRDRMVLFGGYATGLGTFNDVWALSLAGTPAWTQLAPTGTLPGVRRLHGAIYDPLRDRMVVFGGYISGSCLKDTWALSLAGTPAWTQLTPAGAPPSARLGHSANYDPVRDRMVVFGGRDSTYAYFNDVWSLTWGTPALAGVTCPGDIVWLPGGILAANYTITNPCGFAQIADYSLASARDWPGFPVAGSVAVGAFDTAVVPLSAPVPDSAAGGWSSLTFQATLRSVLQHAACTHDLVDGATPVMVSLVSTQADPDRVRLTWLAAGAVGSAATVYRCVVPGAWVALGQVAADGSGQVVYEDRAVTPGARYGYRLGVVDQGREVFAGETWVDVPRVAELALAGVRPNPATRALAVAFSLPDAAPARLEAFDLLGRRVAAREVGPLGGGSHEVRLGDGRALAPGVYLLRLTRGDRVLRARAVIVR